LVLRLAAEVDDERIAPGAGAQRALGAADQLRRRLPGARRELLELDPPGLGRPHAPARPRRGVVQGAEEALTCLLRHVERQLALEAIVQAHEPACEELLELFVRQYAHDPTYPARDERDEPPHAFVRPSRATLRGGASYARSSWCTGFHPCFKQSAVSARPRSDAPRKRQPG